MYESAAMGWTVPKWLTPPKSIRALATGIAGAVFKGTTVTIPTPIGPQTFNLSDPNDVARLKAMIAGTKFNIAPPRPGGPQPFDLGRTVGEMPGGWLTVAVVGLGAVFLLSQLPKMARRS